jgi:hypothetical protein
MYHGMTKGLLTTLGVLSVVGVTLCPVAAHAYELDSQLNCKSSPHAFIAALVNGEYIDPKPMRIEANSVNAFRPTPGSDLTAFGFRVYAIFAYERDDEMFKKGSGEAIADPLYGAVVFGSTESVKTHLRRAGSDADVHDVLPLVLTAVICNAH